MMFLSATALILLVGLSFTATQSLTVDIENSLVEWTGKKVTGTHSGTIQLMSGNLEMTENILTGGKFTIDMNSIKNTDMEGGGAAKLEGHLKSPDFFGVEAHPTATFVISKIYPSGTEGDYRVRGGITIKDITKEIKFNAHLENVEGVIEVSADIVIDRSDFDIKYGSGSFFDSLGDKTIYDEFELKVKLLAR